MSRYIVMLLDQWEHLGEAECMEQIDAHAESEGYAITGADMDALDDYWFARGY